MNMKRAMQNRYFEYTEAYRLFQEAKRAYQSKVRESMTLIFGIYAEWCTQRYGEVLRPWRWKDGKLEDPVRIFYEESGVHDAKFRSLVTRYLDSIYDEKEASS
jgi:hypothetical protein